MYNGEYEFCTYTLTTHPGPVQNMHFSVWIFMIVIGVIFSGIFAFSNEHFRVFKLGQQIVINSFFLFKLLSHSADSEWQRNRM